MIRKMTKEEAEAHMARMFSNLPTEDLMATKKAVEAELLRREMKKTEEALSGKFVFVDPAVLKIAQ